MRSIAFTGHRALLGEEKKRVDLGLAVLHNRSKYDPMTFHSGGAPGFDTQSFFFTGLWMPNDSWLHIPFAYQAEELVKNLKVSPEEIKKYAKICDQCSSGLHHPRNKADYRFYQKRNEHMIDLADEVICYWNGIEKGGTWNAIKYARRVGKPIRDIREI